MEIKELYNRLSRWNSGNVFIRIVTAKENRLVQLNREQLEQGFDKKGNRLQSYASIRYAIFKNALNSKAGLWNPDLKLTGKFHEKIRAKANQTVIRIESTDSKSPFLEQKYSSDIFGLKTDELNEFIKNDFYPMLMKLLRSLLK